MSVYVEESGRGDAMLVLLHGMGATGAVWRRTVDALTPTWDGRILVCDLPGHGISSPLASYSFEAVASAVATVIPACTSLVVVGHSFGGFLAAVLASGELGPVPVAVVAASVKVNWSDDELAAVAAVAAKPTRTFETFAAAQDRYRMVSGLTTDVTSDPADLARGVVADCGRFRLSQDPAALAVDRPDMAGVLAAARCPVLLCRGAADSMVSAAELAQLGAPTVEIAAAGHNVHVEQPVALARCVTQFLADLAPG